MATDATVARIWHGWTTVENAGACQTIVEGEVFPAIFERHIPGLLSAHLMRADDFVDGEAEFSTVIWFESLDSVKSFMGRLSTSTHAGERRGGLETVRIRGEALPHLRPLRLRPQTTPRHTRRPPAHNGTSALVTTPRPIAGSRTPRNVLVSRPRRRYAWSLRRDAAHHDWSSLSPTDVICEMTWFSGSATRWYRPTLADGTKAPGGSGVAAGLVKYAACAVGRSRCVDRRRLLSLRFVGG
jgi:heme-degrading monooxygenase HmoA